MLTTLQSVYKNGGTDVFSGASVWDNEPDSTVGVLDLHQGDKTGAVNTVYGPNIICCLVGCGWVWLGSGPKVKTHKSIHPKGNWLK